MYFINDGIKTFDCDDALRLIIMATLAQDESRKGSKRAKAGQHVSREKGTLYGSGNIPVYNWVGDTYEKQAETIRMISDMYLYQGSGTGKLVQMLTELERLNAAGNALFRSGGILCSRPKRTEMH